MEIPLHNFADLLLALHSSNLPVFTLTEEKRNAIEFSLAPFLYLDPSMTACVATVETLKSREIPTRNATGLKFGLVRGRHSNLAVLMTDAAEESNPMIQRQSRVPVIKIHQVGQLNYLVVIKKSFMIMKFSGPEHGCALPKHSAELEAAILF